jgi:hypothetical protein
MTYFPVVHRLIDKMRAGSKYLDADNLMLIMEK